MRSCKIELINAIELKPDTNYLICLDKHSFSMREAELIGTELGRLGSKCEMVLVTNGDPNTAVKVIAQKGEE